VKQTFGGGHCHKDENFTTTARLTENGYAKQLRTLITHAIKTA